MSSSQVRFTCCLLAHWVGLSTGFVWSKHSCLQPSKECHQSQADLVPTCPALIIKIMWLFVSGCPEVKTLASNRPNRISLNHLKKHSWKTMKSSHVSSFCLFVFIIFNLLIKKTQSKSFSYNFVLVGMETHPEAAFTSSLNSETLHKPVCSDSVCDTVFRKGQGKNS